MAYRLIKLDVLNMMLERHGQGAVASLDSTGSFPSKTYGASYEGQAERVLDRVSRKVQMRGFDRCNLARCKKYTVASPGTIPLGNTVLDARPAGPTQYRQYGFRNGNAYDFETDTATFAIGDYFFDVVTYEDFDTLSPAVQEIIADEAVRTWQQIWRGSPAADQMLAENAAKSEVVASRVDRAMAPTPLNPQPLILTMPQQNQQPQGA